MKVIPLTIAALVASLAVPTVAQAAAPMLIEQSQARMLSAAPADALRMMDAPPFTTGVEHYTRTVGCGWRHPAYVARCLSLEQSPPPPGSTAVYDPEKWGLTSRGEQADWCAGIRLAARLIRRAHATPIISVPEMRDRANVLCAARNVSTIIFQIQPHEADTARYMQLLRQATRWARSARSYEHVVFVLSTASRYNASAAELTADYQQAEQYLGGSAMWWLDVIPNPRDTSQPVTLAEGLLGGIG